MALPRRSIGTSAPPRHKIITARSERDLIVRFPANVSSGSAVAKRGFGSIGADRLSGEWPESALLIRSERRGKGLLTEPLADAFVW